MLKPLLLHSDADRSGRGDGSGDRYEDERVNLHMTYERVENAEKAMAAWRHFAKNTNIGPTLAPVCFEAGLYSYA